MPVNKTKAVKAQVVLYLIIAILIIAIGLSIFFIKKSVSKEKENEVIVNNVRLEIEKCLEEKTRFAVMAIALTGFYANITNPAVSDAFLLVAQYYYDGSFNIPSTDVVARQLELALAEEIDECFEKARSIAKKAELKTKPCTINASVDSSIRVSFACPVELAIDSVKYSLENFYAQADFDVAKLLNHARKITEQYAKDKPFLCTTCYDKIIEGKNLTLHILPLFALGENHTFFSLRDDNNNLILVWAVK
jgi:hypothetical protein